MGRPAEDGRPEQVMPPGTWHLQPQCFTHSGKHDHPALEGTHEDSSKRHTSGMRLLHSGKRALSAPEGTHKDSPKRHHQPECFMHSGKRDRAPELIRGSQGSGCDRPASEGPNKKRADAPPAPARSAPEPTKILPNGTTPQAFASALFCLPLKRRAVASAPLACARLVCPFSPTPLPLGEEGLVTGGGCACQGLVY
jgi:hypothetical protein